MNKNEVLQSKQLIKRFVKDNNLPISIYEEPYFTERLNTLDVLFGCVEKFDTFCEELKEFKCEQYYFEYYNYIKDNIIANLKNNKYLAEFLSTDFTYDNVLSSGNLYKEYNDGCSFISLDIKKANFSVLQYYSCDIFDNYTTWEEYVGQFTTNKSIINSKYIRQVILGCCNPKRQIKYETMILNKMAKHILSEYPDVEMFSLGADEIIIKVPKGGFDCGGLKQFKQFISECPDDIGKLFKVEHFGLLKINGTDGWMRYYNCHEEEKIEFKCLDSDIYHQVVKYYYGLDITDNDLVFKHNHRLVRYLEKIDDPFNK